MNCLNCGKPDADHFINSGIGIAAWNHLRREDPRTILPICDGTCALELGIRMGERIRDDAILTPRGRRAAKGRA